MSLWITPENLPAGQRGQVENEPARAGRRAGRGQAAAETVNQQVSDLFTCPSEAAGRSRAGVGGTCPPAPPPYKGGRWLGSGQGQLGYTPNWKRELGREKARTLKSMDCPGCGRPVMVGLDDEVGGYHEVVAVDPNRLTRLGMYQAATSGRRLFTAHNGRHGLYVNWLGDYARPDPERTHLLAAHDCNLPPADHQPPPPPVDPTDAPPF